MPLSKSTQRYRKTPRGYLNRIYGGIKTRCKNTRYKKNKKYHGLPVMDWEEFVEWGLSPEFLELYARYLESGKDRKLAPSVDRIDPSKGYVKGNVRWLTLSENSKRAGKTVEVPIFSFQIFWLRY